MLILHSRAWPVHLSTALKHQIGTAQIPKALWASLQPHTLALYHTPHSKDAVLSMSSVTPILSSCWISFLREAQGFI